jgi:hypothetical protein
VKLAFSTEGKLGAVLDALVRDGGHGHDALVRMQALGAEHLKHEDHTELREIIATRAAAATTPDNANPCVDYMWTLVRDAKIRARWRQDLDFTGTPDVDALKLVQWFENKGRSDLRRFVEQVRDELGGDSDVAAIRARLATDAPMAHDDKLLLRDRIAARAMERLPLERVPVANRRLWELVTSSTWNAIWKTQVIGTVLSPTPLESTVRAFVRGAEYRDLRAIVRGIVPHAAPEDADFLAPLASQNTKLSHPDRERLVRIIIGVVSDPASNA